MAVSAVKKERAKPADEAEAVADAKPAKGGSKSKLVMILVLVTLISASGGGAYWYMQHSNGGGTRAAKVEPPKPPVFIPLEQFTVNLQLEENPQFLQVGLTLKVRDTAVVDALKLHMPEVRDRTLLLLSSQRASTLLTLDGKKKLAGDIVATINTILEPALQKPAAAAKEKPAETAESADAAESAEKDAAASGDQPAPPAPAKQPVTSVLFTAFIVQ